MHKDQTEGKTQFLALIANTGTGLNLDDWRLMMELEHPGCLIIGYPWGLVAYR